MATRPASAAVAVAAAARNMQLEVVAGEVVRSFDAAGIASILLKGPSLARRLYAAGERTAGDCDLFVSPDQFAAASGILQQLGFRNVLVSEDAPDERAQWADLWVRKGVLVELHRTIWGVGVPPMPLWQALFRNTEMLELPGAVVAVLTPSGLAFHVALHAAQHGLHATKSLTDLERALEAFGRECWEEAARLAAELEATAAFAAGLRLISTGERLAAELFLTPSSSTEVALRASAAPPGALAIDRVVHAAGARQRARLVGRTVIPSPAFMRFFFPIANRGRAGLIAAYALRAGSRSYQLLPSFRSWRRVRTRERRARD